MVTDIAANSGWVQKAIVRLPFPERDGLAKGPAE